MDCFIPFAPAALSIKSMGGARDRIVLPPVAISGEGAERLDGTKSY